MFLRAKTILALVLLLPAGGCSTDTASGHCAGQRLMVTTMPTSRLPVPELQAVLAESSGKPVHYMRTLFEHHYLFCVTGVVDEEALAQAMADMKKRPEIEAVEADRRRRLYNE